ncbi:hypothetical protein DSO57_1027078 [Entomophthora muscae]|uniref:Uncharacterized protein n=1 Tax=Entomophthora muscae TaxID=34485 RepID=A0ACC2SF63_9FUNG|nr:hypothetical protein DSO57_1027078 [Entomophthora muscae]
MRSNFDPQTYFQFQSEQLDSDSDTFWIGASYQLNQKNLTFSSTEDESDDQGDLAFREVFSLDFGSLADDLYTLEEEERLNLNREDIEKLMTGFCDSGSFQTRVTIPAYKPWKTLSPEPDNQVVAKAAKESTIMPHKSSHKQLDAGI